MLILATLPTKTVSVVSQAGFWGWGWGVARETANKKSRFPMDTHSTLHFGPPIPSFCEPWGPEGGGGVEGVVQSHLALGKIDRRQVGMSPESLGFVASQTGLMSHPSLGQSTR